VLNRVESTEYSQATTVVYTQEYPLTLLMVGIGQMSRLNCLLFTFITPCLLILCNHCFRKNIC